MECQKKSHSNLKEQKRIVKLNQQDGMETLEVTQKIKLKKKKIKYTINVTNICEHDCKNSRLTSRKKHKICHKKCKARNKEKSLKTELCNKKTEESKQSRFKKHNNTDIGNKIASKCKESHSKILDSRLSSDSETSTANGQRKNRPTPQCTRNRCRLFISELAYNRHIRREIRKLQVIRKREEKHKKTLSLSPISSSSSAKLNLEDISSDSFTSYDEYNVENKLETLIKRTKNRDKLTSCFAKSWTRTSKACIQQETELTQSETAINIEDDVQMECIDSETDHSIHSQATLILEPQAIEKTENNELFAQMKCETGTYSPTYSIGNKESVSDPKNLGCEEKYSPLKRETELYYTSNDKSNAHNNPVLEETWAKEENYPTLSPYKEENDEYLPNRVALSQDLHSQTVFSEYLPYPPVQNRAYSNVSGDTYSPSIGPINPMYSNSNDSQNPYQSFNDGANIPKYTPHSYTFIPMFYNETLQQDIPYDRIPDNNVDYQYFMNNATYSNHELQCPLTNYNPYSYIFHKTSDASTLSIQHANNAVNNMAAAAGYYYYGYCNYVQSEGVTFDSNSNYITGQNYPSTKDSNGMDSF